MDLDSTRWRAGARPHFEAVPLKVLPSPWRAMDNVALGSDHARDNGGEGDGAEP
jgi:hypothetical protein